MQPGDNYAKVDQALRGKGWDGAFVVHIDARSLELLCEDLGSAAENRQFNKEMDKVLGIAEQIRFCDRRANPYFDKKHPEGYDAMKTPINCTWGFHRPPRLLSEPACGGSVEAILQARFRAEEPRQWTRQPNAGEFALYQGTQSLVDER